MKSLSAPRRVYSTHGTLALCFNGTLFAYAGEGESALRKDVPATITEELEDGGIVVKQRKAHSKAITETWYPLQS